MIGYVVDENPVYPWEGEPGGFDDRDEGQSMPGLTGNAAHAFIVRLWVEASGREDSVWRGSIEQVGTGKQLYFYDLSGVERFICEQTGIRLKPQKSWLHKIFLLIFDGH